MEGWENQILSFVRSTYDLYQEDYMELAKTIAYAIVLVTCDAQWKCACRKYGLTSEPEEIRQRHQDNFPYIRIRMVDVEIWAWTKYQTSRNVMILPNDIERENNRKCKQLFWGCSAIFFILIVWVICKIVLSII